MNNDMSGNYELFRAAVDAQTDMEKLKSCQHDFRLKGVCDREWLEHRLLPQFFIAIIHIKDQLINIYVNENVIGAQLIISLFNKKIVSEEEALWSYLETLDGKTTFELHDPLGKQNDDIHLIIKQHTSISPDLNIYVQTLTSATHHILSSSTETICMIKCRIEFKIGIPMDLQRLIFQGKLLEDKHKLSEYGINSDSTFHLVLNLRGGKPVIRLRSTTGQSISDVNVHLHLHNTWKLSSIYPEPSHTDKSSFIQWNHIDVFPDGRLMMKENHKSKLNHLSRCYPSIDDELEYRMLFWEALTINYSSFNLDNGLCVSRVNFPRILNYLLKKMLFSSEDRDDMITYILPHLDEIDPDHVQENIIFRFLSPNEYSNLAELNVRPEPDQMIRAFLLYRLSDNEQIPISTMEDFENEIKKILGSTNNHQSNGLILHEWGSMIIQ